MTDEYHKYILSPKWFSVRRKVFELKGKYCERCKSKKKLHVHHKTYERLFNENIETDLCVLCTKCHDLYHTIHKKAEIHTTNAFIQDRLLLHVSNTKKKVMQMKQKRAEEKKLKKGLKKKIQYVTSLNRKRVSRIRLHEAHKSKQVDLLNL